MPAYKDKERNTWYSSFKYKDWSGKSRSKTKRVNYSQVSRHKKVKNIQEQTKDSAANIKILLRLE